MEEVKVEKAARVHKIHLKSWSPMLFSLFKEP